MAVRRIIISAPRILRSRSSRMALGPTPSSFPPTVTPPTGRTALLGMYEGSVNFPVNVSTWLGYHPDFDGDHQGNINPNGSGGNFGTPPYNPGNANGGSAYPWIPTLDISQVWANTSNRFTYANMAAGNLDGDYNATLNTLNNVSDQFALYAIRIDHEFEAAGAGGGLTFSKPTSPTNWPGAHFFTEGTATCIAAWRRLGGLIKTWAASRGITVITIWNPGGMPSSSPFDYTPWYPGGPGSNIDAIGTDGGYFNPSFDGANGAAAWLNKFGNASTVASINDFQGGISWLAAFARSRGVQLYLGEWADQYQGTGGGDVTAITNMCNMINNPANSICGHMYWNSGDSLGSTGRLSAQGQAVYQAAFANKPYTGTFFTYKTPPGDRAGF